MVRTGVRRRRRVLGLLVFVALVLACVGLRFAWVFWQMAQAVGQLNDH